MDALPPKLRAIARKLCRLATLDKLEAVVSGGSIDNILPDVLEINQPEFEDGKQEHALLDNIRSILQEFENCTKDEKARVIKHFEKLEQKTDGEMTKSDIQNVLGLVCSTVRESDALHKKALQQGNRFSCYFIAVTWLSCAEMRREQDERTQKYLDKVVRYLKQAYNEYDDIFAAFLLGVVCDKFYGDRDAACESLDVYFGEKAKCYNMFEAVVG
jgi:hypothetical protein